MKIKLKQQNTGLVKQVKLGFSWTSLFFGCLVPFFRGDFIWAAIHFFASSATFGLFWVVFPFFYNKKYLKNLMESKGYVPADSIMQNELVQRGIMVAPPTISATAAPRKLSTDAASMGLKELIQNVFKQHAGYKKTHDAESFAKLSPADVRMLQKKFDPWTPRETVLFAAFYNVGSPAFGRGLTLKGIMITEQHLYYRLYYGMTSSTKCGKIALADIQDINVDNAWVHATYGGGKHGPELNINGVCHGWMETAWCIPDEDAALLQAVFTEINNSGVLQRA
jgi:hypothetical protein